MTSKYIVSAFAHHHSIQMQFFMCFLESIALDILSFILYIIKLIESIFICHIYTVKGSYLVYEKPWF